MAEKNRRRGAAAELELARLQTESERQRFRLKAEQAHLLEQHPPLLRWQEIEAALAMAQNSQAQIYLNFDRNR